MAAKPSTLTYLLIQQHLLRHAKPKSPVCQFRRSFSLLIHKPNQDRPFPSFFSPTSSSLPLQSPHISLSSLLVPKYLSSACEPEQDKDNVSLLPSHSVKNDEEEEDGSDRTLVSTREIRRSSEEVIAESSPMKLSAKEKKKLASYAHSLGDKLKCQLVGKSGVTDSVVFSVLETLEKNELLKVKIHRTCPGTLEDMILHLEEATGSVVVGKIGRTLGQYQQQVFDSIQPPGDSKSLSSFLDTSKFNPTSKIPGGFSLRKRNQLRASSTIKVFSLRFLECRCGITKLYHGCIGGPNRITEISIPGQEEEGEGLTLVFLGDQGVGKTSIITSCTVTSTTVIRFLISPSTLID
ncbi:BnaA04g12140D [Brassica napus]|uniref:BnaA04g12140D protein n=1 Tax=Brassica napus TaxID=3708 RepID=A0A078FSQ9_BRANA|nr:BnaA04g12140D [Brassica napus]